MLVHEHKFQNENVVRKEFEYFNILLGEFSKIAPNKKKFKGLLLSAIFNYDQNSFLNAISEIAVCIELTKTNEFLNYEKKMNNGKNIDFEFLNNKTNEEFYVEVFSIHFNPLKYEDPRGFKSKINKNIKDKFDLKTIGLSNNLKQKVFIFPVIHYLTIPIVKENVEFLNEIKTSNSNDLSYNSFTPKFFGSIGTSYSLLSVEEILNY